MYLRLFGAIVLLFLPLAVSGFRSTACRPPTNGFHSPMIGKPFAAERSTMVYASATLAPNGNHFGDMGWEDDIEDSSVHDNALLQGSAILHKTPLMLQLEEVERDMKRNYRSAREMISIVEKDLEFQKMMRKQTSVAIDRLKMVKGDMILQLNQARSHYEDDRRQLLADHQRALRDKDRIIAKRNALIDKMRQERQSIRRMSRDLIRLMAQKISKAFILLPTKLSGLFSRLQRGIKIQLL